MRLVMPSRPAAPAMAWTQATVDALLEEAGGAGLTAREVIKRFKVPDAGERAVRDAFAAMYHARLKQSRVRTEWVMAPKGTHALHELRFFKLG